MLLEFGAADSASKISTFVLFLNVSKNKITTLVSKQSGEDDLNYSTARKILHNFPN